MMGKKYNKPGKTRKPRKTRKLMGGIVSSYENVFTKPSWQIGSYQWTTLVRLKGTQLYGSSIPHENVYNCLATLHFYMHVKNIKQIISLQGCSDEIGEPHGNCRGFLPDTDNEIRDKNYEKRVWDALKNMSLFHSQDNNITFQNHKIQDMTAGTLSEWCILYNYDYNNPEQITLIHCLAGFGRTGSILLLVYLNQYYTENPDKRSDLSTEYLGYDDGESLISALSFKLYRALDLDDDKDVNGDCNEDIISFNKEHITDELFNPNGTTNRNTLITRLNYIRICLAYGFNQSEIYLYTLKYDYRTIENMLDYPTYVQMSKIDDIISDPENKYGIIF